MQKQEIEQLKGILTTVMSVEESQIMGNYREVRRLLLKSISDLNGFIEFALSQQKPTEEREARNFDLNKEACHIITI